VKAAVELTGGSQEARAGNSSRRACSMHGFAAGQRAAAQAGIGGLYDKLRD
jgi:hypothetical protein